MIQSLTLICFVLNGCRLKCVRQASLVYAFCDQFLLLILFLFTEAQEPKPYYQVPSYTIGQNEYPAFTSSILNNAGDSYGNLFDTRPAQVDSRTTDHFSSTEILPTEESQYYDERYPTTVLNQDTDHSLPPAVSQGNIYKGKLNFYKQRSIYKSDGNIDTNDENKKARASKIWKSIQKHRHKYSNEDTSNKGTSDGEDSGELRDLKSQIAETSKEIDNVYSKIKAEQLIEKNKVKEDPSNYDLSGMKRKQLEHTLKESFKQIKDLREQLHIERQVRKSMRKYLINGQIESSKNAKALEAILKYFRISSAELEKLKLPHVIKKVIIKARIKLLPSRQKLRLAKFVSSFRKGDKDA